jgi:hypothetical protein
MSFDIAGEAFDVDDFLDVDFRCGVEGGELMLEVVEALVEVVDG